MSYATLTDIRKQIFEDELIRLTDEDRTNTVDEVKVTNAIETADVEIDAYLGEKYTLPMADAPPILTKLSVDLAIRNLYLLAPGGIPEDRDTQAKNCVRMLEKIANGSLTLGASDPQNGSTENAVTMSASPRLFSRDKLRGF